MKTKRLFISTLIAAAAMGLTAYANEAATQTTPVIAETDAPEGADKLLPLADAPAAEDADAAAEETQDADALELLLADDAIVELDEAAAPDELSTETMMREWIARYAAAARFAGIRSVKGTGGGLSSGGAVATAGADLTVSAAAPTPSVSVPAAGTVSLADTLTRASAAGVSLGSASASDAGTVSVATASSASGTSTILPAAFFGTRSVFSVVPAAAASYSLAGSSGVSAYTADDGTTPTWAGGIDSDTGRPLINGFTASSSNAGTGQKTMTGNTVFTFTSSGNIGINNNDATQGFNTANYDVKLMTSAANTQMNINGNFLGSGDVWFAQGRWKADAAGRFAALGEIYVIGGQIWMTAADTFTNNFILGSGTFNEGYDALDRSSFRFNANITFNGTTTILAEGTKLSFQGNYTETFANLTGSGNISFGVYSGSSVLAVTGATNYTGKINLISGISLNWSADSTFGGLTGTAGTVAAGSKLNIAKAGSDMTSFSGTVGSSTSGVALALSGSGSGTQAFTGTNYFSTVSVADTAALRLGGTTTVSGATTISGGSLTTAGTTTFSDAVSVTGGMLTLGGTVSLANTVVVSGSGSVSVNDSVIFILNDNYKSDNTWTLISGASSVDGWSSLTPDNFRKTDGSFFIGRSEINVGTSGAVTITEVTPASLVWNGTSGNSTWNTSTTNKNWTNNNLSSENKADSFYTLDNVTFDSTATNETVTLADRSALTVGDMTVTGGSYTFQPTTTASASASISGNTLRIESGATLTSKTVNLLFDDIVLAGELSLDADKFSASALTWGKLTFEGGTLHIEDTQDTSEFLSIREVAMKGAGSITSKWSRSSGTTFTIETLSGTGDLSISGGTIEPITYSIGRLSGYTGTLSLEGSGQRLTVLLTGNNTGFTSNVKVSAGILGVNNPNALGSGTLTLNGGTLQANANNLSFSNTINVTAASSINTQGNTLTLGGAVSGTGTLRKTGAGTLVLSGDTLSLSDLVVSAGTVQVKNSEVTIGRDKTLTKVTLANGTTLQQYSGKQPTAATTIGELALSGATATLAMTNFQGYWNVDKLNIGQTSATLNLASSQSSSNTGIFEFGASSAGDVGNFAGTFNVTSTDSGASRSVSVVLSNGDIAENAVVNLASATSTTANLSLGVNADRVTIAGLVSTLGDKAGVYSGRVGTAAGGGSIPTSDTITRTLVINTAEGGDYTFNGKILANLNLEKRGAGAQTLSGTSILGDVSVSGGTLTLGGTATINHSKDSAAFTVSGGSLIFSEGLALTINLTGSGMLGDSVSLFDVSGSGVVSAANLSLSKVNFLYNGYALSTRITDVAFDNSTGVVTFTGSSLSLTWNGGTTGGTWDTAAEGATVTNTPWRTAEGREEAFYSGDFVTFNGNATVTIASAGVSAGKVTVDSGAVTLSSGSITSAGGFYVAGNASLTVSAALVGSAAVVEKTGAGTLVLSGNNTFTGKLLISGGLVELGSTTALGVSEETENSGRVSVEIATGGTLDLKGKTKDKFYGNYVLSGGTLINTGTEIGTGARQLAGGITLTADSTIGGTHNFGMISGGYAANGLVLNGYKLTKTGENKFWLAATTISAGTIEVLEGSITLVRTSTGDAATFKIGNAGTLELGGTAFSVASITTEGDGAINLGGANGTLTLLGDSKIAQITSVGTVVVSAGKTLTLETGRFSTAAFTVNADAKVLLANGDGMASIANVFSGAGSMEKTGSGTTTLLGTNIYTGGTTLSAGTLVAANASALGSGTLTAAGSDGVDEVTLRVGETGAAATLTLANDISVSAGKTLILESSNEGNALAGAISGSGALKLSSGTLSISGSVAGESSVTAAAGTTLKLTSTRAGSFAGDLTIESGAAVSISGKETLKYSDFAADETMTIRVGGVLDLGDKSQRISTGAKLVLAGGTINASATLASDNYGSLDFTDGDNTIVAESGESVINATIRLRDTKYAQWGGSGNLTFQVNDGARLNVAGVINPSVDTETNAGRNIIKTGAGELTLSGANTNFRGDVTIEAGTLIAANSSALGTGTVTAAGSDGVNEVTLSIDQDSSGNALTIANDISVSANKTLILESSNDGNKLSGALSGAGKLTVTGTGKLTLSGADTTHGNEISGGVVIDGATLSVNSAGWGNKGNLGKQFSYDGTVLKNGGVLEVTAAQDAEEHGDYGTGGALRGFSVAEGTGTYRYTTNEDSSITNNADDQFIGLADDATLIFDVVQADATLTVTKVIAKNEGSSATTETNGTIVKTGAGTLKLTGDNSKHTGKVTLSAGTLEVGHRNALGDGSAYNILDVTGDSELKLGSGLNVANSVAFDNSARESMTLTINAAADTEISGILISYAQNEIRKVGAGTLTLSGDNSYFSLGTISVEEGTILAKSANALGAVSKAGNNKVRLSGGQLEVGSGVTLAQTNIAITLNDLYKTETAITGTGKLANGTTITISKAENAAMSLSAEAAQDSYKIYADTLVTAGDTVTVVLSKELVDEGWIGTWKDGVYTLVIPEPSLFGLLAGATALGFSMSSRRRRRKA